MSADYVCPLCGHPIARGNPLQIRLHNAVSHTGKTPIVETPLPPREG